MQRLECPIGDCTSVPGAETDDAVIEQAADHASEHHPEVELDDETESNLRSRTLTV